ncbi:electron transport complex subunit RsxC [Buchnera aphidicola]|uniref:electron transport complex subunit RsxC n=1 Tax=Buchnera aphidicola TaxID=9 RepID=UPI0016517D5C|nr:electron transport complex subunit RsxC [Buchnera aphidicola]
MNRKIFYREKHRFYGGIDFVSMKINRSSSKFHNIVLPKNFFILIDDVITLKNKIVVNVGQLVLRGQILALGDNNIAPVHSPTSGLIIAIVKKKFSFFSKKYFSIINIKTDGKDNCINFHSFNNYKCFSTSKIIQLIYNSGIIGLGGAGFLSSKKLKLAIKKAHTLVINAVESEPYITSDDCLVQHFAKEIIEGCKIITWILKIKCVLIVLEDGKHKAYIKLKKELKLFSNFSIRQIKKKYPSGSSKQLIQILFNKEIPYGKHSIDLGIVIFNVSTVFSIKRAVINGEPLIERIVTISDSELLYQKNVLIRIGTPISHVLSECNINIHNSTVIIGGPITGRIVNDLSFSILKTNSSILCTKLNFMSNKLEGPCIRCTECSRLCPIRLLPEQLYFYSKVSDHKKSQEYHINECIECGICEQVCPSNIPLITYFKKEQSKLNKIKFKENMSKRFKKLFLSRQSRLYHSDLIHKNIVNSNSPLDEQCNNSIIINNNIERITIQKSNYFRKIELKAAISRAKLKKDMK